MFTGLSWPTVPLVTLALTLCVYSPLLYVEPCCAVCRALMNAGLLSAPDAQARRAGAAQRGRRGAAAAGDAAAAVAAQRPQGRTAVARSAGAGAVRMGSFKSDRLLQLLY